MKNLVKKTLFLIGVISVIMSGLKADLVDKASFLATKLDCGIDNVSCYNTGVNYRDGLGTEEDTVKALEYFKKACKEGKGYMDSCYNVGDILSGGYDLDDYGSAVKYYKMSADKGDKDAIANLANLYGSGGINLMVDHTKSIFYGKKACDSGKGDSKSCYNLASQYMAIALSMSNDSKAMETMSEAKKVYTQLCKEKNDGSACEMVKTWD